ncbi:MAG: pentapeptide repeat-containing protein [Pseudomonadota bacterium]
MRRLANFLRKLVHPVVGHSIGRRLWRWYREDWPRVRPIQHLLIPPRNGRDPTEHFFLGVFRVALLLLGFSLLSAIITDAMPGEGVWFPYRKIFPDGLPSDWDGVRSFAFALAGIVGAVFGLFQLHNSAARTRLSGDETRVKQEQERNERFVRAVELLRDDDASVRMAGVYALERLALEKDANYAATVIKVLSGFVRERTTRGKDERTKPERTDKANESCKDYHKRLDTWLNQQEKPTEPITAAMRALGAIWQEEKGIKKEAGNKDNFHKRSSDELTAITFENAILTKLDAPNIDLSRCDFRNVALERANLWDANLEGANLWDANLEGANLWGANLEGANLWDANLEGAYLAGANLRGANLTDVKNLTEAQLEAAVWPTGAPPKLPSAFNAEVFDKEPYTDPDNPERLKPRMNGPSEIQTRARRSTDNH